MPTLEEEIAFLRSMKNNYNEESNYERQEAMDIEQSVMPAMRQWQMLNGTTINVGQWNSWDTPGVEGQPMADPSVDGGGWIVQDEIAPSPEEGVWNHTTSPSIFDLVSQIGEGWHVGFAPGMEVSIYPARYQVMNHAFRNNGYYHELACSMVQNSVGNEPGCLVEAVHEAEHCPDCYRRLLGIYERNRHSEFDALAPGIQGIPVPSTIRWRSHNQPRSPWSGSNISVIPEPEQVHVPPLPVEGWYDGIRFSHYVTSVPSRNVGRTLCHHYPDGMELRRRSRPAQMQQCGTCARARQAIENGLCTMGVITSTGI